MKKRIGSNYGILVVLLFAVVCALTDYIIIGRKVNEAKNTVIETVDSVCNCDSKITENNVSNNIIENKSDASVKNVKDYAVSNELGIYIVTKTGDVFFRPNSNSQYNIDFSNDNIYKKGTYKVDNYIIGLDENDNEFEGYKINISNIQSVYSFSVGQEFDKCVVFIDYTGNVSVLNLKYSSRYDVNSDLKINLSDYSNIKTAVANSTASGNSIIFIDKDGNHYNYY